MVVLSCFAVSSNTKQAFLPLLPSHWLCFCLRSSYTVGWTGEDNWARRPLPATFPGTWPEGLSLLKRKEFQDMPTVFEQGKGRVYSREWEYTLEMWEPINSQESSTQGLGLFYWQLLTKQWAIHYLGRGFHWEQGFETFFPYLVRVSGSVFVLGLSGLIQLFVAYFCGMLSGHNFDSAFAGLQISWEILTIWLL